MYFWDPNEIFSWKILWHGANIKIYWVDIDQVNFISMLYETVTHNTKDCTSIFIF